MCDNIRIGKVIIRDRLKYGKIKIFSDDWFFRKGEDFIVTIKHDCCYFSRPTLDYRGETFKCQESKSKKQLLFNFRVGKIYDKTCLPFDKVLYFDKEDSNTDLRIAYFKE